MAVDLSRLIFIDNHAHSLAKSHMELDVLGFRQCFTESRSLAIIENHVQNSVHYMHMLNAVGKIFATSDEEDFVSIRSRQQEASYVRILWDDVSMGGLVIDDGFKQNEYVTANQLSAVSQRPIYLCRRIEPLLEQAVNVAGSFTELEDLFRDYIAGSTSDNAPVALKTICAYRGGLEIDKVDRSAAEQDFSALKSAGTLTRIERRPLYHYFLMQAFELAACHQLPLQIHTGIGDDDASLSRSNPLHLQDLFRSDILSHTQFVLLHTYPFVREAACLASLYPNVYFDLSLSIVLASPLAEHLIGEALAAAPASKLLAGTDGHTIPEMHWYGALCWKRALSNVLTGYLDRGILNSPQCEEIAALILHGNVNRLYRLSGP